MDPVKELMAHLKYWGVKVWGVQQTDDPEVEDDAIQLAKGFHLQVGEGYFCLVEEQGDSFVYHYQGSSLPDLRKALNERGLIQ